MTLYQTLFYDDPPEASPTLIDFDGVPMVGDVVWAWRNNREVMCLIETRQWRKVEEPIAGSIVKPGQGSVATAMKRHHKLFVGLRAVEAEAKMGLG